MSLMMSLMTSAVMSLPMGSGPILMAGFWLGVRHATEPDHVVAVTTMATQGSSLKSASRLGLLWGLGHSVSMMLVGLAVIAFGRELPADLSRVFEGAAGASLLLLAWRAMRVGGATASAPRSARVPSRAHPSFLVGIVHGLAGSATLALLLLTTIHSSRTAVAYLMVFAAGTTLAMGTIAGLLARVLASTAQEWTQPALHRSVRAARMASAVVSVGVGVTLLARSIGVS
jgi:high-affinity nickel permease